MRVYNSILSNLRESENNILGGLVSEINSVIEYANEVDDPDDVFYGTQDSYANEIMEQNLFDAIAYSPICNEDFDKASLIYDKVMDYVYEGKPITEEILDKIIKSIGGK